MVALRPLCPELIEIWKCWFLRRGENRSTRRKTSRSKDENQQQTQTTSDAESGNRTRATLVRGECSHRCAMPKCLKVPKSHSKYSRHSQSRIIPKKRCLGESPSQYGSTPKFRWGLRIRWLSYGQGRPVGWSIVIGKDCTFSPLGRISRNPRKAICKNTNHSFLLAVILTCLEEEKCFAYSKVSWLETF